MTQTLKRTEVRLLLGIQAAAANLSLQHHGQDTSVVTVAPPPTSLPKTEFHGEHLIGLAWIQAQPLVTLIDSIHLGRVIFQRKSKH